MEQETNINRAYGKGAEAKGYGCGEIGKFAYGPVPFKYYMEGLNRVWKRLEGNYREQEGNDGTTRFRLYSRLLKENSEENIIRYTEHNLQGKEIRIMEKTVEKGEEGITKITYENTIDKTKIEYLNNPTARDRTTLSIDYPGEKVILKLKLEEDSDFNKRISKAF